MKHYKITSANAEKHFGKIQHTFKTKNFSLIGMEENFLNLIKASTKKPKLISFNRERLMFPLLDQEEGKDVHGHHFYSLPRWNTSQCTKSTKGNKRDTIGKEEEIDMIVCIEI